jgi:hypothetical protein
MNPNLTTFLVLVALVLSLFARELFSLFLGGAVSKARRGKCKDYCGTLGWSLARKDRESCHAICIKCGWMSHFDLQHWQELNKQ